MNLFKTYFFVLIAGSLFLSCTLKRDNVLDINNNLQNGGLAILTTTAISSINKNNATSGGNITDSGATTIIARGVCWSINPAPTIAQNIKTSDGTGIGSFTSNITGLVSNTTYYVRAYATNTAGTGYGNQQTFVTYGSHAIGDTFGGGIIAYILQPGDPGYSATVQHGLIAAPTDQSTSIVWWNGTYVTTGATGLSIGTGMANTNAIIAAQGAGTYAASICRSLTLGGYSDWFLPSKDELNKLYINKNLISGFAAANYWSSSECNINIAWLEFFVDGLEDFYGKGTYSVVRAVRAF